MQKVIEKLTAILAVRNPDEPMHVEALRARAEAYAHTGRHREALRDAVACLKLSNSPATDILLFCGQQKLALGDFEGALADANKASGKAGTAEEITAVLRFRARVLRHLGRFSAASADAEQLRRLEDLRD